MVSVSVFPGHLQLFQKSEKNNYMLNEEKVIEIINRCLELNLDPKNTPVDVKFKELGIDSLDSFNVLIELEALTGRNIPDDDVAKLVTIKSLVEYFG